MKTISLRAGERPVTAVKFNREGDLIFTAGTDGIVSCYKTQNGDRVGTYTFVKSNPYHFSTKDLMDQKSHFAVSSIDVKHDSSKLLVAAFTCVNIFDCLTGRLLHYFNESAKIVDVQWSQNYDGQNKFVLCHHMFGGNEGGVAPRIKVYEMRTTNPEGEPEVLDRALENEYGDVSSRITVDTNERYECLLQCEVSAPATRVRWGPLDESIVSSHEDGSICLWDAETGKQKREIKAHSERCTNIAFDKQKTLFLSVGRDGWAKLWRFDTFTCLREYQSGRPLNACDISPLLSLDQDANDRRRFHVVLGGGQEAKDVTTTASQQGGFETLIVNIALEQLVGHFESHFSPTHVACFSSDGMQVATGVEEGNVRIVKLDKEYLTAEA